MACLALITAAVTPGFINVPFPSNRIAALEQGVDQLNATSAILASALANIKASLAAMPSGPEASPPPAPPIPNLLENGDFETGSLGPWKNTPNGGSGMLSKGSASWIGDATGGDHFVHLKGSCGSGKGLGIEQNVQNLEVGKPYVVTFWASAYYDNGQGHGTPPAEGNEGEVHIVAGGNVVDELTYKYVTHAWAWGPNNLKTSDTQYGQAPAHEYFQHEFVAPASNIVLRMVESTSDSRVKDCINIDAVRLFMKPYA